MSNLIVSPSYTASGNISEAAFVVLDSSNPVCVLTSGANGRTVGISAPGSKFAPGSGLDNGYAAVSGDNVTVYGPGVPCLVTLGSGGCTAGNLLESDASGNAVVSTVSGHNVGAIALESGSTGEQRRVLVVFSNHP